MSKDPARCSVKGCTKKPLYKIGAKGYCAEHKPDAEQTRKLAGTSTIATEPTRNFCGY
jgi:hypothetical protein